MHEPPDGSTVSAQELLRSTWTVVFARAGTLVLITAACLLPGTLLANAARRIATPHDDLIAILSIAVHLIGTYLAHTGITQVVVAHLRGEPPLAPMQVLGQAVLRVVPALITGLAALLATLLGLLLFVVPGVIVWLTLFAAVPAAVIEHMGPLAAMRRSADLTHGSRGAIALATLALVATFIALLSCGCSVVACFTLTQEAPSELPPLVQVFVVILNLASQGFLVVGLTALSAVFYARARGLRERIDADDVAETFS